jgi:hypothetical protein
MTLRADWVKKAALSRLTSFYQEKLRGEKETAVFDQL